MDRLAAELIERVGGLLELHTELSRLMQAKLEAIRGADSDRMQSITAREMLITGRIGERESDRRKTAAALVEVLGATSGDGANPGGGTNLRLTELAEYLPEPRRSQLLVMAAGLRDRLEEIERLRVTTTLITREVLRHMGEVFAVMRGGTATADVYSRTGARESTAGSGVFEAVG
jgi:hypothetical protein